MKLPNQPPAYQQWSFALTFVVAANTSILKVKAVVSRSMTAVYQPLFWATTSHIIQMDLACSFTIWSQLACRGIFKDNMYNWQFKFLIGYLVVTYCLVNIPVVCRPLWHQDHPSSHHTQSPTYHWSILPPFLPALLHVHYQPTWFPHLDSALNDTIPYRTFYNWRVQLLLALP